jgi:hypothetical protein
MTGNEEKDASIQVTTTEKGKENGADEEGKMMIGKYTEEVLLDRARVMVKKRTSNWEIPNEQAEERIPRFHRDGTCVTCSLG